MVSDPRDMHKCTSRGLMARIICKGTPLNRVTRFIRVWASDCDTRQSAKACALKETNGIYAHPRLSRRINELCRVALGFSIFAFQKYDCSYNANPVAGVALLIFEYFTTLSSVILQTEILHVSVASK